MYIGLQSVNLVEKVERRLPATLEKLLSQYKHQRAMDESIRLDSTIAFAGLCEELAVRGNLSQAMRGKDEAETISLLKFFAKQFRHCKLGCQKVIHEAFMVYLKENAEWLSTCADEDVLAALLKCQQDLDIHILTLNKLQHTQTLLATANTQ